MYSVYIQLIKSYKHFKWTVVVITWVKPFSHS